MLSTKWSGSNYKITYYNAKLQTFIVDDSKITHTASSQTPP